MPENPKFTIQTDAKQAREKLAKLGLAFDEQKILNAIGLRLLKWINDNFKAEGLEKKWKPLSENTLAARRAARKGASGSRILQVTGRLRQSFTYKVHAAKVVVGSQSKIAEYHHFGTEPYIIRPRTRSVLLYAVAQPGRKLKGRKGFWQFSKEVHHPGLPERRLLPSNERAEILARGVLNAIVNKAVEDFNRRMEAGRVP